MSGSDGRDSIVVRLNKGYVRIRCAVSFQLGKFQLPVVLPGLISEMTIVQWPQIYPSDRTWKRCWPERAPR